MDGWIALHFTLAYSQPLTWCMFGPLKGGCSSVLGQHCPRDDNVVWPLDCMEMHACLAHAKSPRRGREAAAARPGDVRFAPPLPQADRMVRRMIPGTSAPASVRDTYCRFGSHAIKVGQRWPTDIELTALVCVQCVFLWATSSKAGAWWWQKYLWQPQAVVMQVLKK